MVCTFQRCFSPYLVQANKNNVRSDIKIQGETTMTRFVLAVILAVASTFVGSNVAAAASKPSLAENETRVSSGSGPGMDFSKFRQANAENSSHLDPPGPRTV
jgi:hypothetical protein